MALDVMDLMWAICIRRFIERLGSGKERREFHLGPNKYRFSGPPLPVALVMDLPPSKSLSPSAILKKNRYISFAHLPFQGPKQSRFSVPTHSNGPCNGFGPIKGGRGYGEKFTSYRVPPTPQRYKVKSTSI